MEPELLSIRQRLETQRRSPSLIGLEKTTRYHGWWLCKEKL